MNYFMCLCLIHPAPGGEEGQSAALAAGAARDVVAQGPPATLDSRTGDLQAGTRRSRLAQASCVLVSLNNKQ